MPVPDFQSLMLPTLTALSGSSDTSVAEVRQRVAAAEGLTPEEVQELLPSGRQPVFTNRVSWAIIHMERDPGAHADLVDDHETREFQRPVRSVSWDLTDRDHFLLGILGFNGRVRTQKGTGNPERLKVVQLMG